MSHPGFGSRYRVGPVPHRSSIGRAPERSRSRSSSRERSDSEVEQAAEAAAAQRRSSHRRNQPRDCNVNRTTQEVVASLTQIRRAGQTTLEQRLSSAATSSRVYAPPPSSYVDDDVDPYAMPSSSNSAASPSPTPQPLKKRRGALKKVSQLDTGSGGSSTAVSSSAGFRYSPLMMVPSAAQLSSILAPTAAMPSLPSAASMLLPRLGDEHSDEEMPQAAAAAGRPRSRAASSSGGSQVKPKANRQSVHHRAHLVPSCREVLQTLSLICCIAALLCVSLCVGQRSGAAPNPLCFLLH